jgi:uncharacterized damage-inducible protein DinB
MTNREFFIERWEREQPAFIRVLRAVPEGNLTYRPHERSTAAGALAWQLAEEQAQLVELFRTGAIRFMQNAQPETMNDIAGAYEKATNELRDHLKSSNDEQWLGPAKMLVNEAPVWEDTLQNFIWGYLLDMIHHRGQLSVYLRPMGGKVPAIYGPSADDSGS